MRPNRLSKTFAATFALGLVLAGALQPAFARSGREEITPAEEREFNFDANIPGCQASEVLERLSSHFAEKEAKFWNSSLTIVRYEHIERTAWRPWGLDYYPRRYCSAVATTSDGIRRKVDYSVRDGLGIIGADWGIEFCVHGLDRNRAYAYSSACREARP